MRKWNIEECLEFIDRACEEFSECAPILKTVRYRVEKLREKEE